MDEDSLRHAREQLEDELRKQVLAAQKAHRAATDNFLKILDQYRVMLDHPDSAHALHQAASAVRVAAHNFAKALRDFAELTVYHRCPGPTASQSAKQTVVRVTAGTGAGHRQNSRPEPA
jgi:hypothetical protein